MNLDLFADDPAAAPPPAPAASNAPAPAAARRARREGESFPMQPTHDLNVWSYKDHFVTYDPRRETADHMRWATIESMGRPIFYGHEHADVCRQIDTRMNSQPATTERPAP